MNKEWIIDVLADLRACALNSKMTVLAEHLDDAMFLAATELGRLSHLEAGSGGHCDKVGDIPEFTGGKPNSK